MAVFAELLQGVGSLDLVDPHPQRGLILNVTHPGIVRIPGFEINCVLILHVPDMCDPWR